jgi:hypothetical protein
LKLVTPAITVGCQVIISYTGAAKFSIFGKAINSLEADAELEVSIGQNKNPHILNETLTLANTWYTINLPARTRQFRLLPRGVSTRLEYKYSSLVAEYATIPVGCFLFEPGLGASAVPSILVRCPLPNVVVEIEAFTDQ